MDDDHSYDDGRFEGPRDPFYDAMTQQALDQIRILREAGLEQTYRDAPAAARLEGASGHGGRRGAGAPQEEVGLTPNPSRRGDADDHGEGGPDPPLVP